MADTRDNHEVSRVLSSQNPDEAFEVAKSVTFSSNDEPSPLPSSKTSRMPAHAPHHSVDRDPRKTTVPASMLVRSVSLEGAGPRAKHQRRPVTEGNAVAQRRNQSSSAREFIMVILISVLVVVLARVFVADVYVIPSGSMEDTLQVGDRIITSKLSKPLRGLKRGDVVVFKDPANWLGQEASSSGLLSSDFLVKRLIGLPGDRVQCCNASGKITINGEPITETSYIRPGVQPSAITFDITVTADHIFVLGDNRSNSADSRYHANDGANGLVPEADVVGVAKFVYWPLDRLRHISRPDAVFANVPEPSAA